MRVLFVFKSLKRRDPPCIDHPRPDSKHDGPYFDVRTLLAVHPLVISGKWKRAQVLEQLAFWAQEDSPTHWELRRVPAAPAPNPAGPASAAASAPPAAAAQDSGWKRVRARTAGTVGSAAAELKTLQLALQIGRERREKSPALGC